MIKQKQHTTGDKPRISLKSIQQLFFRTQLVLIISLALMLGIAGTLINLQFEKEKRDQNLQNIAEAIARSPMLVRDDTFDDMADIVLSEYLDTLKETLDAIDVISVVNTDNIYLPLQSRPCRNRIYRKLA